MTADAPPRIRPGLVWAIFLMHLFGTIAFIGLQVLRGIPWLPVNLALETQIGRLTRLDWGVQWALAALGMTAATLLFLLRRPALWLCLASTLLGSANAIRLMVTRGWAEPLTSLGGVGVVTLCMSMALSLLISAAILGYVVSLYRRGVLY